MMVEPEIEFVLMDLEFYGEIDEITEESVI